MTAAFDKIQDLRYGENPHQKGAFYREAGSVVPGICTAKQLQGKELSFNNIMDLNAAFEIAMEFVEPAAAIIKHTNPCGAASAEVLSQAYIDAIDCDRLSAFGSIVGFNGLVDRNMALTILEEADFVECIIAPDFSSEALELFTRKKNTQLMKVEDADKICPGEKDYKKVRGGLLVQERDIEDCDISAVKCVTDKKPSGEELKELYFGWKIVKHVRSNAIVLCSGTKTVGIGRGRCHAWIP
jgi:phosphoribosylaminoimidazolecarboxamide formyltransferase/IMP cyclohydrolase